MQICDGSPRVLDDQGFAEVDQHLAEIAGEPLVPHPGQEAAVFLGIDRLRRDHRIRVVRLRLRAAHDRPPRRVPGRRTTLELLPAVWLFGTNDNFVGQTLKTDPMFKLDAHLTRDFTEKFRGGLDLTWYKGSGSSINGVQGGKLNNVGVGLALGYTVNENLNLTVGYKSTANDSAPTDLRMDGFMVTLVFGWHPMVEGMRWLKGE